MRIPFLFLCFSARIACGVYDAWRPSWLPSWKAFEFGHRDVFSETGKGFATLLGYPAKCVKKGFSHSCTFTFACWLIGGSSESGCKAHPWIVSCCVTNKGLQLEVSNEFSQTEDKFQDFIEVREDAVQLPVIQKRRDKLKEECGLSSSRILTKRIIGGKEAKFGEFPWQAHIKILAYQCGGVLVSRNFVATAAHCVIRARLKDIKVFLGELDTQDSGNVKEFAPAEMHRVIRKLIHPNFEYRATQPDRYDIALLELAVEAGDWFHIMPVCLPMKGIKLYGKNAVVAGWGKVKQSSELDGTNILRRATVPILDIKLCTSWHEIKQIVVELHDEMFCAGHQDGHQDACLGDSGGPLIVLEEGRWTLAGITSAGFGCGEPHQPGIYHSVPHSATWIRSVIN